MAFDAVRGGQRDLAIAGRILTKRAMQQIAYRRDRRQRPSQRECNKLTKFADHRCGIISPWNSLSTDAARNPAQHKLWQARRFAIVGLIASVVTPLQHDPSLRTDNNLLLARFVCDLRNRESHEEIHGFGILEPYNPESFEIMAFA